MSTVFVGAIVIAVVLSFYFYQQTRNTLKQLQADGFTVDESIQSNPQLVIDRRKQRMAVIYAKRYEQFDFSQIESVDYIFSSGDSDRGRREIKIQLKDHPKSRIVIKGRQEELTDKWLDTIKAAASQ